MNSITVYDTDFWQVKLLDNQAYLGYCVVVLKRPAKSLSDVSLDEMTDFHKNVVLRLEKRFTEVFGATLYNWTCLMNNAYKLDNPIPQVHFHFRPRYKNTVEFAGETFIDSEFAHHYDRKRKHMVSVEVLDKIKKAVLTK